MIPNNIIEDIRYRCDIEDVIGSYVALKRSGGSNLKGLCPFHSERTPSFVVYRDTQSYYCFGCGAGGDVINFIMRQENLDYISAVEFLAKRAGIALPDFSDGGRIEGGVSRTRVLQMNKEAARFFRKMLFDDTVGTAARMYLIGERMLDSSVVKHFGIGYSPKNSYSLRDHLQSLGFTYEELVVGYLCGKSERGYYDYFRGRVMFPIIDVSGNIVAFGGRVLDGSKPKYLNTSDTPAFKKSKNLFALNYAKNSDEETLIICEGYMDVIALHAAGFTNSVATLGTAITPEHARIIKRYAKKAILAYDGDEAGRKASDRAIKLLAEVGVDSRILVMEGAKDPDEYIKKFGSEAFRRLLDKSRSRFDYVIETVKSKYDTDNADDKIKAAGELCGEIAKVYSKVEREIYIEKTASALGISKKNVEFDVETAIRKMNTSEKKKRAGELIRQTSGMSDRINLDYAKNPKIARLEEDVLGILMIHPEYLNREGFVLSAENFFTDLGKRLFGHIKDRLDEGGYSSGTLSENFGHDEVSRAIKMQTMRRDLLNDENTFDSYAEALKNETKKYNEKGTLEEIISFKRIKK